MMLNAKMFTKPFVDGWLDTITEVSDGFLLEGWAFRRSGTATTFPTLIVTSDWLEILRFNSGNIDRSDVVNTYPNLLFCEEMGFSVTVPFEKVGDRGAAGLQVFVVNKDGSVSQLKKGFKRGLQVELTGRCNLRCPMCPSVIYSDFHKKELGDGDIPELIDFLQDRDFICLDGFGESLLAPNFGTILDALPRASEVVFHTNGLLLDKKADEILRNSPPVAWVAISLDSLDPQKYSKLRAGSSLAKVLENIRTFKKKRDELGFVYPIIRLNLTLMKENYLELSDFVRAAQEFDSVVECNWLYDVEHLGEGVSIEVAGEIFDYESNKLKHIAHDANEKIEAAHALAKELGVEMLFNSYFNETLSESLDIGGYGGEIMRSVSDCPHLKGDFMLQADGKVQNCVWQTSPLMDWRKLGLQNVKCNPRIQAVKLMAEQNMIPYECSGAGCSYVHLQTSNELSVDDWMIGGYSGGRVLDKKTIKIRKV